MGGGRDYRDWTGEDYRYHCTKGMRERRLSTLRDKVADTYKVCQNDCNEGDDCDHCNDEKSKYSLILNQAGEELGLGREHYDVPFSMKLCIFNCLSNQGGQSCLDRC